MEEYVRKHLFSAVVLVVSLATSVQAQEFGYAAKRPVIGGACPVCPWGALAEKVKAAMAPSGYDVQVCYSCSGIDSVRIVSERRKPVPLKLQQARELPQPPAAPVDFGVVNLDFFVDAYRGEGRYKADGPRSNLRLIATIEDPNYFLVATRRDAWITDLKQINERHLPVKILADDSVRSDMILDYYGLDRQSLASWGATRVGPDASNRDGYDVIITFANSLNNTPESNVWYELSQKSNLRFLQLPDDLLNSLAKASEWEIGNTPVGLLRGMDKPIKTILTSGTVIYGRDDMPDQFAYDVAKAVDEHKRLLIFSILPFSYNPAVVWQARGVPLHPGAERYYREKGYMPSASNATASAPTAPAAKALAQPPAEPAQPARSAEVSPNGNVTFRLLAPKATEVVVNGDWPNGRGMVMSKDASGIWTLTTPPLGQELWTYTFSVDGVTMPDPGNPKVLRDITHYLNGVVVPGGTADLYLPAVVPHGSVTAVWYPSTGLKTPRRLLVYTPPGYKSSKESYPVLYLFHGGSADEEAWNVLGQTNVIMDNMIAAGKAKPMIVVMPNANWDERAVLDVGGPRPERPENRPRGLPPGPQNYDRAENEIVNDIVSFIEKNYRAIPDREARAITGLSMGGGIAINVGLKRLDKFAWVGQFSAGMFGGVSGYAPLDIEKISPGFLKDPAETNQKLKLLYFSCGIQDPRHPYQTKAVEQLRGQQIELTFHSFEGAHDWKVWRRSLVDFAGELFR
jgi:enterochelin esterase-like enzyme/TRAP-type uncharacterized transport system substrate-binding protein